MHHRAHVVQDSCVGEAQDGVSVELQLDVALPVGLEPDRVAVLRAVEFHHTGIVERNAPWTANCRSRPAPAR